MRTLILIPLVAAGLAGVGAAPAAAGVVHEHVTKIGSRTVVKQTYDTGSHRLCVTARRSSQRSVAHIHAYSQTGPHYSHRFKDRSGGGATCLTLFGAEAEQTFRVDLRYDSAIDETDDHWYI